MTDKQINKKLNFLEFNLDHAKALIAELQKDSPLNLTDELNAITELHQNILSRMNTIAQKQQLGLKLISK